ncbi:MAG: ATP synthase subunit I [Acidimicrobiales bacterium]|nr:ATP synthase subunit I [Acidimicrobiales bacterium]
MSGDPFLTRFEGPAPEQQIAHDMVRRGLPVAPLFVLVGFIFWGVDGALSAGLAVAIVLANFALSAAMLAWAARISLGLLMGAALGGFLARLAIIMAIVLLVIDQPWVEPIPLCLTLVVAYLGLLAWELKYVSASLAFPALKPGHRPVGSTKE